MLIHLTCPTEGLARLLHAAAVPLPSTKASSTATGICALQRWHEYSIAVLSF